MPGEHRPIDRRAAVDAVAANEAPRQQPSRGAEQRAESALNDAGEHCDFESTEDQKMDEAAGFDVKDAKAQLKNDQYNLKQLGNTEADNTAREKLTESIADSQARIADAEAKVQQAGIDIVGQKHFELADRDKIDIVRR